jgi:hypothetical protein
MEKDAVLSAQLFFNDPFLNLQNQMDLMSTSSLESMPVVFGKKTATGLIKSQGICHIWNK